MRTNQKYVAIGVTTVAGLILAVNVLAMAREPGFGVDMNDLFPRIAAWWSGRAPLYPPAALPPGEAMYRYPPLWAVLMVPLVTRLDVHTAVRVWAVLSLAVFFGGLIAVSRALKLPPISLRSSLVMLMIALLAPFYETLYGPTKELIIVGLVAIAFAASQAGRRSSAGFALALAAVLKVYPLLFAPYFLLRRDFKVLAWLAGWMLVLISLPLPFRGFEDSYHYFFDLLPHLGGSSADAENGGVDLLLMSLAWLDWFDRGVTRINLLQHSTPAALACRLCVVGLVAAVAYRFNRHESRAAGDCYLLFGLWIAAVLLLIPVSWVNYQIFLIVPTSAFVFWFRTDLVSPATVASGGLLAISVVLTSTPFHDVVLSYYGRSGSLATSIGEAVYGDFMERVATRESVLQRAAVPASLAVAPPADVRRFLRDVGVPDAHARGPRYVDAMDEWERMTGTDAADTRRRLEMLRRERLTNYQLVGWIVSRPIAGILAFVAMLAACLSAVRLKRADSIPIVAHRKVDVSR